MGRVKHQPDASLYPRRGPQQEKSGSERQNAARREERWHTTRNPQTRREKERKRTQRKGEKRMRVCVCYLVGKLTKRRGKKEIAKEEKSSGEGSQSKPTVEKPPAVETLEGSKSPPPPCPTFLQRKEGFLSNFFFSFCVYSISISVPNAPFLRPSRCWHISRSQQQPFRPPPGVQFRPVSPQPRCVRWTMR